MAGLYIVATPIGNLDDITLRAIETFKSVDIVACEDTRRTLKLLTALRIKKPLVSCRTENEAVVSKRICVLLGQGKDVAYASDAGTPGLRNTDGTINYRHLLHGSWRSFRALLQTLHLSESGLRKIAIEIPPIIAFGEYRRFREFSRQYSSCQGSIAEDSALGRDNDPLVPTPITHTIAVGNDLQR